MKEEHNMMILTNWSESIANTVRAVADDYGVDLTKHDGQLTKGEYGTYFANVYSTYKENKAKILEAIEDTYHNPMIMGKFFILLDSVTNSPDKFRMDLARLVTIMGGTTGMDRRTCLVTALRAIESTIIYGLRVFFVFSDGTYEEYDITNRVESLNQKFTELKSKGIFDDKIKELEQAASKDYHPD